MFTSHGISRSFVYLGSDQTCFNAYYQRKGIFFSESFEIHFCLSRLRRVFNLIWWYKHIQIVLKNLYWCWWSNQRVAIVKQSLCQQPDSHPDGFQISLNLLNFFNTHNFLRMWYEQHNYTHESIHYILNHIKFLKLKLDYLDPPQHDLSKPHLKQG